MVLFNVRTEPRVAVRGPMCIMEHESGKSFCEVVGLLCDQLAYVAQASRGGDLMVAYSGYHAV